MAPAGTNANTIPEFLRTHPTARWLRWRLEQTPTGKATKRPDTSTRTDGDWRRWSDVADVPRSGTGGVGFIFTGGVLANMPSPADTPNGKGGWLVALDLDACYFNGAPTPWAAELIEAFDRSYTEVSPSGHGLRMFVILSDIAGVEPLPLIRVPAASPIDKHPGIQVFGLGPAGYVTVTGEHLKGTKKAPAVVEDLGWIVRRYEAQLRRAMPERMPEGHGDEPSREEIDAALRRRPALVQLIDGDWSGYESASEGWFFLSTQTLAAARGHVDAAADYLLGETAYGRGDIDSRDPNKYANEDWVRADLLRIFSKRAGAGAGAFDDGFDAEQWASTATPTAAQTARERPAPAPKGWFLTLEEYAARHGGLHWLVRGVLPATGLAQIYGDPSSGKTTVAVDLAVHVALGLSWLGGELVRPGWVLYIAGEGGPGLNARFEAARARLDPEKKQPLRVVRSDRPGSFTDPKNREQWAVEAASAMTRLASSGEHVALVVVDTQARNFGPGNENSSEDMGTFVSQLDALGRAVGALVLVVHHTGHGDKTRGRGSSAMFAALDAAFEVTRPAADSIRIDCRKAKDWAEPGAARRQLVQVVLEEPDAEGRDRTAVVLGGPVPLDPEVAADVFPPEIEPTHLFFLLEKVGNLSRKNLPYRAGAPEIGLSAWAFRALVKKAETCGFIRGTDSTRRAYIRTPAGDAELARMREAQARAILGDD